MYSKKLTDQKSKWDTVHWVGALSYRKYGSLICDWQTSDANCRSVNKPPQKITVALNERTSVRVATNDTRRPAPKFGIVSWRHFRLNHGFRPPISPFLEFFSTYRYRYDECTRKKTDLGFVFRRFRLSSASLPPACHQQATF
jgi:hypothetical protein